MFSVFSELVGMRLIETAQGLAKYRLRRLMLLPQAMARARAADASGDKDACEKALTDVPNARLVRKRFLVGASSALPAQLRPRSFQTHAMQL
jgi:hypothetical protein